VARILVIDDEPGVTRFVRRALESAGHTVHHANDGPGGLACAARTDPDAVILDLLMPGLSGMGVLGGLRAESPRARILVASAVGDVESKVRCLELGADDYLVKPFAISELLARINSRLREVPAHAATRPDDDTLQFGDVRLHRRTRTLSCDGASMELSPREFTLIHHLMQRAGDVCTRGELLSEVWGYAFDPGSNVVDVTVARLRSKIRGLRIETVRNVGYILRQA